MKSQFNYIVVEGPIGVGKTTLAKQLANTFNTDLILELPDDNPFLAQFYEAPTSMALATQLYFFFQRVQQISSLKQNDLFKPVQVSDFMLEKDYMFAKLTLSHEELMLYDKIYQCFELPDLTPDLVIYLQADVDFLMQRIYTRNHDYEKMITRDYIKKVSDTYVDFFYHYYVSPLLIINTDDFDLTEHEQNYNLLLQYIDQPLHGRHYLNP